MLESRDDVERAVRNLTTLNQRRDGQLIIWDDRPGKRPEDSEGRPEQEFGFQIPARQDILVLGPDTPSGCLAVTDERDG